MLYWNTELLGALLSFLGASLILLGALLGVKLNYLRCIKPGWQVFQTQNPKVLLCNNEFDAMQCEHQALGDRSQSK